MLGVLCCIFGCINPASNFSTKDPTEKFPIQTLSIEIDENKHQELFAQLRKFSEKHLLDFHLSFYTFKKVDDQFSIEMRGKMLHISAFFTPINPTKLDFAFYEEDSANPPSQETVDELYNDLKVFISEIPNVKIVEEK
jgi:hypothetical protein